MSATIDTTVFTEYLGASLITIPGVTYPVEVFYSEEKDPGYVKEACELVVQLHADYKGSTGEDILVFLTGEDEIRQMRAWLRKHVPDLSVGMLYGNMTQAQQTRALQQVDGQKCLLATNIAETSLTIGGLKTVVDCGLVKTMKFNPRTRSNVLATGQISKASAKQRTGRAGRTAPGWCFRLYGRDAYEDLPDSTPPAVHAEDVCKTVLRLNRMDVVDVFRYDYLTPPAPEQILYAVGQLADWYVLTPDIQWRRTTDWHMRRGLTDSYGKATPRAQSALDFPAELGWYVASVKAHDLGCLQEISASAAVSMLRGGTIFVRPDDVRHYHLKVLGAFAHPLSDHATEINALRAYQAVRDKGGVDMYAWADMHHIDVSAADEALDNIEDIKKFWSQVHGTNQHYDDSSTPPCDDSFMSAFGASMVEGFFHHTAIASGGGVYRVANNNCGAVLDATSMCLDYNPEWVVFDALEVRGRATLFKCTYIDAKLLVVSHLSVMCVRAC
jgi:pre-mRNA-splicing factor ATP-dependent RNA helicase DHX15/PRP43